jgi:hypothetical protein
LVRRETRFRERPYCRDRKARTGCSPIAAVPRLIRRLALKVHAAANRRGLRFYNVDLRMLALEAKKVSFFASIPDRH